MMSPQRRLGAIVKILVFLFPIALFLVFLSLKMVSSDRYAALVQEDSVVEYLQALFYFLSGVVEIAVAMRLRRQRLVMHTVLYCILGIALLFVSLEEISWGQRLFHIANPGFCSQHNIQHEMSVHNLDTVQPLLHKAYILTGAYGAFACIILRLFFSRLRSMRRHLVNFVVPDCFLSSYFFFVFLIYSLLHFFQPTAGSFLIWRDQEPAELILSMGFLAFGLTSYMKSREISNSDG